MAIPARQWDRWKSRVVEVPEMLVVGWYQQEEAKACDCHAKEVAWTTKNRIERGGAGGGGGARN